MHCSYNTEYLAFLISGPFVGVVDHLWTPLQIHVYIYTVYIFLSIAVNVFTLAGLHYFLSGVVQPLQSVEYLYLYLCKFLEWLS